MREYSGENQYGLAAIILYSKNSTVDAVTCAVRGAAYIDALTQGFVPGCETREDLAALSQAQMDIAKMVIASNTNSHNSPLAQMVFERARQYEPRFVSYFGEGAQAYVKQQVRDLRSSTRLDDAIHPLNLITYFDVEGAVVHLFSNSHLSAISGEIISEQARRIFGEEFGAFFGEAECTNLRDCWMFLDGLDQGVSSRLDNAYDIESLSHPTMAPNYRFFERDLGLYDRLSLKFNLGRFRTRFETGDK